MLLLYDCFPGKQLECNHGLDRWELTIGARNLPSAMAWAHTALGARKGLADLARCTETVGRCGRCERLAAYTTYSHCHDRMQIQSSNNDASMKKKIRTVPELVLVRKLRNIPGRVRFVIMLKLRCIKFRYRKMLLRPLLPLLLYNCHYCAVLLHSTCLEYVTNHQPLGPTTGQQQFPLLETSGPIRMLLTKTMLMMIYIKNV